MEHFDNERAKRVWQRVQGETQPLPQQPAHMCLRRELSDGAVYQQLYRRLQGDKRQKVRQLYMQKQENAAVLRGICSLSGEKTPVVTAYPVDNAAPQALLQQCYAHQLEDLAEYESKAADPRFGRIYQQLARQAEQDCVVLLALIGSGF